MWKSLARDTIQRLSSGGWVPNFVVGLAFLLLSPVLGYVMQNPRAAIISVAIGVTIIVWVVAWAAVRSVTSESAATDKPQVPPVETPVHATDNTVNVPNALANERLANGVYLEGRRNNVLEKNCIEDVVAKNKEIAKLIPSSQVAPAAKQVSLQLEPQRIVNLELNGAPVLHRRDYTFSYIVFSETPDAKLDILSTLETDSGVDSSQYDLSGALPFQDIKANSIKTYRPQISHFYPAVPRFLKGKITITNLTNTPLIVALVLPVIEEGLFASSPIDCGAKRGGEFLSYAANGNMPSDLNQGGTISFSFSPSWNADRLTPGINPHFLSWTNENQTDGIKVISDSRDHGKIKLVIMVNGKISVLASEITPLKGTIYAVDVRFAKQSADLVVNGNTWSKTNIQLPNASTLANFQFYIGSNPSSEDDGAFSTMSDVRIYNAWLNDDQIKIARGH